MDARIPDDLVTSLRSKAPNHRTSRFRVRSGDREFDVLKLRANGFDIAADGDPHLRGYVDLMHGANRLAHCLILHGDERDGVVSYEFKLRTPDHEAAPADYARAEDAPVALLKA